MLLTSGFSTSLAFITVSLFADRKCAMNQCLRLCIHHDSHLSLQYGLRTLSIRLIIQQIQFASNSVPASVCGPQFHDGIYNRVDSFFHQECFCEPSLLPSNSLVTSQVTIFLINLSCSTSTCKMGAFVWLRTCCWHCTPALQELYCSTHI